MFGIFLIEALVDRYPDDNFEDLFEVLGLVAEDFKLSLL